MPIETNTPAKDEADIAIKQAATVDMTSRRSRGDRIIERLGMCSFMGIPLGVDGVAYDNGTATIRRTRRTSLPEVIHLAVDKVYLE